MSDATPPSAEEVAAFRARHCFVRAGDGGIVIDVERGHYFALNRSAALICERLTDTAPEVLIATVAAQFGLPTAQATGAIADFLAGLVRPQPVPQPEKDDFPYRRDGDRYVLFHRTTPLLEVSADGSEARLPPGRARGFSPGHALRLASPKILQVNGVTVLHAAACRTDAGLLVVSGRSGAGKSTTARVLRMQTEADAFCDDLLVLGPEAQCTYARTGAEEAIYKFCDEAGETLAARPREPIALAELVDRARIGTGPLVPIDRVFVVARERRRGTSFTTEALPPAEALVEILSTVFLGAADRASLAAFLRVAGQLAEAVPMLRAYTPDGVGHLAQALRAYISNTISNG